MDNLQETDVTYLVFTDEKQNSILESVIEHLCTSDYVRTKLENTKNIPKSFENVSLSFYFAQYVYSSNSDCDKKFKIHNEYL